MKILMLLPVNSQPRLIKRVEAFIEGGNDVTVAYQIRDYFKKNELPMGCRKVPLVHIESGKYYKRPVKLLKSISILKKESNDFDIIYAFSIDLLFISLFLKARKRYYEIGDLRIIRSRLYNVLYLKALKKQDRVIVTSSKFSEYLQDRYDLDPTKIEVIENKLDPTVFDGNWARPKKERSNKIKVGIIGLLRYQQVLDFLAAATSKTNNLEVHIYGSGVILEEVLQYANGENVIYHGEFKYPNDLDAIYRNVDISFVMYNSNDINVRLALPNKLYESIYYKTPLIVSTKTYLSEKVEAYGIGFAWNIGDMHNLPAHIERIFRNGVYSSYVESCGKIDKSVIYSSPKVIV